MLEPTVCKSGVSYIKVPICQCKITDSLCEMQVGYSLGAQALSLSVQAGRMVWMLPLK